jgi:hypothetical protein
LIIIYGDSGCARMTVWFGMTTWWGEVGFGGLVEEVLGGVGAGGVVRAARGGEGSVEEVDDGGGEREAAGDLL